MPALDPASAVLSSPMLVTRFTVRRRTSVIGNNGRITSTNEILSAAGVVVSSGSNGQDRKPSSATGFSSCAVITKFPLRKQAGDILPDVVLYRGLEYLVTDVQDCLDYGPGWVFAQCTSDNIADPPIGA